MSTPPPPPPADVTNSMQFERYYNVTDKAMLAWDRIVGNLLEQAMPFLTLFWLNIGLAAINVTDYRGIAIAGWVYVVFRALYSVSALTSRLPLRKIDQSNSK